MAAEFDQFTPEVLERIRREQEQFARAYPASQPVRHWEAPFIAPVPGGDHFALSAIAA